MLGSENLTKAWVSGKQKSWQRVVIGTKESYGKSASVISNGAAQIIETVEQVKHKYTLTYFCGLHQGSYDYETQATRLTKNLLAQMLERILYNKDSIDLKTISLDAVLGAMRGTWEGLRSVLEELIFRLPEGSVVHCVIDNIGLYWEDNDDDGCGAELVLPMLRGIKDRLDERNKDPLNPHKVFLKMLFSSGPEDGPFKKYKSKSLYQDDEIHVLRIGHPEKPNQ